jgi:site-specific DNA-methyltransferase (adenine-specific)
MILVGDVRDRLSELADESVNCVVTSPPYWGLRDYGQDGQIGLERTPGEYIDQLVSVFREVRRVLRDDGTLWLNLGDCYSVVDGLQPKNLVGIPWRMAFALQADGWCLRQDIIWHKPNPMPESVTDRCTKSHEYLFLLTKSVKYYYDQEAIKEPSANLGETSIRFGGSKYGDSKDPKHATKSGNNYVDSGTRNKRSVWTVAPEPFKGAHFATFPPRLIEPCILAGCPENGTVLDPFFGAGTTGLVAQRHNRRWIGCELNPEYAEMARRRIEAESNLFTL